MIQPLAFFKENTMVEYRFQQIETIRPVRSELEVFILTDSGKGSYIKVARERGNVLYLLQTVFNHCVFIGA
jgi:hypothetical protein